jgi:hypothetical protein
MTKGTALFDTVAISGTEAKVRAGLVRRCAVGAGVGGRGATADCNGRGWVGWCAERRRRGEDGRWRRHVQGRLDLEQHGGACAQRESRVHAPRYGTLRGAARPMDGAHGAAHACCGERFTSMRVASVHRGALHVALARVGVLHRFCVASCVCARCMLHRRALHRRALHRRVASAWVASALVASACVASAPVASAPRSRPAAPLPCDAL